MSWLGHAPFDGSLGFVETGAEPFGEPFAVLTLTKDTS
jgi:hypothetical protein